MRIIPQPSNPAYAQDRCQCLDCGYIFLRPNNILLRLMAMLFGELCPNCASRKTISLGKMAPQRVDHDSQSDRALITKRSYANIK